jgi:hypothetical protein
LFCSSKEPRKDQELMHQSARSPLLSLWAGNLDRNLSLRYHFLCTHTFELHSYALGYGPVSWTLTSELFPDGIRGRALGGALCYVSN